MCSPGWEGAILMNNTGEKQKTNGTSRSPGAAPPPTRWTELFAKATQVKEALVLIGSVASFVGGVVTLLWQAVGKALTVPVSPDQKRDALTVAAEAFAGDHLLGLAVLEAVIILVMWVALASSPSEEKVKSVLAAAGLADEGGNSARNAANFRKRYEWLLWSWIALYLTLSLAHYVLKGVAEYSLRHVILHIVLTAENSLSAVFLVVMYQALGGHSHAAPRQELGRGEKAAMAGGLLLIATAIAWALVPQDDPMHRYLSAESGWRLFGFA